jgi:GntR family transcriptional regulator, transcriptional repressor for pyruvate dehydrogenase complex
VAEGAWDRIAPARPRLLGDQVFETLAQLIRSGELRNGERLASEEELCRRFEVSRPVVRRALARLRGERLIVSRKGSGSFVSHDSIDLERQRAALSELQTILYALEYRRSAEPDAAGYAALRRSEADLDRLEAALAALHPSGLPLGPRVDFRFHQAVAAASQNAHYVRALDLIAYDIDTGILLAERLNRIGQSDRRQAIYKEHAAIVEAIRAQSPEAAAAAMRRHLDHAQTRVIARASTVGGITDAEGLAGVPEH